MRLIRIKDSIQPNKTLVFHSTASREELADIILERKFQAGRGGGKMLGGGFYANQHLYQAKKNNYGKNILQAQVFGIRGFLILDEDIYEVLFGKAPSNFIWKQLSPFADKLKIDGQEMTESSLKSPSRFGSTAQYAQYLWEGTKGKIANHFYGFEYSGNWDKESIVCWYPEKCIKPVAVSFDNAETWIPVSKAESYLTEDKKTNLHKAEAVRSVQRARDLINRYEKYPDDKLLHAIKSQLLRIADPAKKEQRRAAFVEVLNELRPTLVDKIGDSLETLREIDYHTAHDLYRGVDEEKYKDVEFAKELINLHRGELEKVLKEHNLTGEVNYYCEGDHPEFSVEGDEKTLEKTGGFYYNIVTGDLGIVEGSSENIEEAAYDIEDILSEY